MDIGNLGYIGRSRMRMMLPCAVLLVAQIAGSQANAQSTGAQDTFPRLGGYQIGGWAYGHNEQRLNDIAKLDIAVIQLFVDHKVDGYSIADITSYLKSRNPELKLLQYVIINEVSQTYSSFQEIRDKVSREKGANGKSDWYARNAAGDHVWEWPGTWMLNFTDHTTPDANGERLPEWLADWFSEQYFEVGGQWDGFFIDVMNIEPQKDLDWDTDGVDDSRYSSEVVDKYTAGQMAFYNRFLQRYPNFIGMGNITDWQIAQNPRPEHYNKTVMGGLIEGIAGFSWSQESWGGFDSMMDTYNRGIDATEDFVFFHVHGNRTDYRFMRYTLASCLMNDGYYTHTTSDSYDDQAWFDEFDVELGRAMDPPQTSPWSNGVYRRVFENGVVLVNPRGNGTQTVDVGSGLKRFSGTQDPSHNNGSSVTALTLAAADGIILMGENSSGPDVPKPKPPILE